MKYNNPNEIKIIEPDYKSAFQLLYGFCLGKGMKEELEKHPDLMAMIKPKWFVPLDTKVVL